jgi:SAM-dependent methyltransferase
MSQDTYLLDHGWSGERERLEAIAALFDPGTRRHLAATGLGSGWRCLEVGGGTGTVAQWLCDQVGPSGQVVVTDLDIGFCSQIERDNLEVRRHDITRDPLEEEAFDLVHTRLVLEHLYSREAALATMARALRPGGWLVVEAIEWSGLSMASTKGVNPYARAVRLITPFVKVVVEMFNPAGLSLSVGHRLPALFAANGLVDVSAEGRSLFLSAGTPGADVARLSLDRAADIIDSPPDALRKSPPWTPVGLVTRVPVVQAALRRRIERMSAVITDPDLWTMMPPLVVASGRRPPA